MMKKGSYLFRRFLFGRLFENIYYFLAFFLRIFLSIVGIGVGLAIIIFVLELLFPTDVHVFNYALTDKTFSWLYKNHNYHAAIFIAEGDPSYISKNPETLSNKVNLQDCYIHVGDYTEAEKLGREFASIADSVEKLPDGELPAIMMKTADAKVRFRLYEKMGDLEKQMEMYKILVEGYNNPQIRNLEKTLKEQGVDYPTLDKEYPEIFSFERDLKYDIICGLYYTDPAGAIDSLTKYLSEVWECPKYNSYKRLTIVNKLILWHLEREELFAAQRCLLSGIDAANSINFDYDYEPVGEFAEYCYILHDKKNARKFLSIYMRFMDKYYSDTDLEYLLAEMRYIKYSDDDFGKRVDKLKHCCKGIRESISRNFAGMTVSQQQYFADKMDEPFSYALQMLANNPNDKDLIELCFENEVFKRGLLLRSEVQLRHALEEAGDTMLMGEYKRYVDYKRELVAREEIPGPGNYARKMYLKSKISSIEKYLSENSAEFVREKSSEVGISKIMSALKKNETLVTFVELASMSGNSLGAFVLNKKHGLRYLGLCSSEEVASFANSKKPVYELCKQPETYIKLFSKIEFLLTDGSDVLYSPMGIIHRIPLAALKTEGENTLGDRYNLSVIANPVDLAYGRSKKSFELDGMQVALWGGIVYGLPETEDDSLLARTRAVTRGKHLKYLPGTLKEVNKIEEILRGRARGVKMYIGADAKEGTFKKEAGKANVIHLATHGFFSEDEFHELNNVMHNAGLFFADANKAWMDDFKPNHYRKGYEDGILRAEEIETQNLASCELVVLSACETGLGEIKGDEGVYGLQRAFKLAGVKCMLMSLWPVPDDATKELMNRFYINLIALRDIDMAFVQAQKSMRADGYKVIEWGGFVILH